MKAFRFRLDQALRWREQSVLVEEARVAAAGARVAAVRAAQQAREEQTAAAAREAASAGIGAAFRFYDGFLRASRRQAVILAQEEKTAGAEYAAGMALLVEANRKARLMENLRQSERRIWQSEFDRELAAFAAEAFLARQSALRRAASRSSPIARAALNAGMPDGTIKKHRQEAEGGA